MRRYTSLALALIGAGILAATPVWAQTITTTDGVLSIDTPDDTWKQTTDANFWVTLTNGSDRITVTHLSNGDPLPTVDLAGTGYAAVYQAFLSTENEVFAVKGTAAQKTDLQKLINAIGTIKILQYDTKTKTRPAAAAAAAPKTDSTQAAPKAAPQSSNTSTQSMHLYTAGSYEPIVITLDSDGFWRNSKGLTYTSNGNGVWMDANGITLYETAGAGNSDSAESETTALYTGGSYEPIYITLGTDGIWRNTMGLTYISQGNGIWTDGNGMTLYENPGTIDSETGSGETAEVYTYGSYEPIYISQGNDGVWRNSFGLTYYSNGDGTWTDENGQLLYSSAEWGDVVDDAYAAVDPEEYAEVTNAEATDEGVYYDGESDNWYEGDGEESEYYENDEG